MGNEQVEEFYIEQPLQIEVSGKYHGLGAFVSGIASLPRIVTLHDFEITQQQDLSTLAMKITAKHTRYKELDKKMIAVDHIAKLLCMAVLITAIACAADDFQDLDNFMAEIKSRPVSRIKPMPTFKAYRSFTYNAASLHSPFDKPVEAVEIRSLPMVSDVRPDANRTKEYLEQFSLDSLSMVGTLEQNNLVWALVQDKYGAVHRVRPGNYIGRNHGHIIESTKDYIAVIEIVSNGVNGWIERPRTIQLKVVKKIV